MVRTHLSKVEGVDVFWAKLFSPVVLKVGGARVGWD